MKIFCLVLAMIFCFCGCFSEKPEMYEETEIPPITPGSGYQSMPQKIFLPLINFLTENELEIPDNAEIFGTRVEIPVVLPENTENSGLVTVGLWPELVEEIKKDYPAFDPENPGWKSNINFFTQDGKAGILQIKYYISDNIITDKAIIGTIEDGTIIRLDYTNIDFETDEEKIRAKAEKFLASTTQAKRIFEEGEEFLKEETTFHYHYPSDILAYCYQLYFYVDMGETKVINNDWGYECIVQ
ncbi:MAG: hypothetical protein IJO22_02805 [Oscillospiraceae bacterium]|nr:hypothetical protein [Oscillospiraceae bacterium]